MVRRPPARYRTISKGAIKIDVPHVAQLEDYTCGPSALLAVCAYFGVGPEREELIGEHMGATEVGTDPAQLVAAARRYGLRVAEHRGMTRRDLCAALRSGRPVILMLQAWAERPPRSYEGRWDHGHWVVAIGFDQRGVYFEDPALHGTRGYLSFRALDERWHDVEGPTNEEVERYGVVVWRAGARSSAFDRRARLIE